MSNFFETLREILAIKLFGIAGTPITISTLMTVVIIILATFRISRLVQRAIEGGFKRRGVKSEGTIAATSRLVHYLVLVIGLGIALQTAGVDLSALFAAGALFAVAIGFAMQNITQNFVSGLILLIERVIKPGDVLNVNGQTIRVLQMGIRSTVAITLDDEELIIPNSVLVQSTVANQSFHEPFNRARITVGVSYDSDMKAVRGVLEAVGARFVESEERPAAVRMLAFGNSSVDFELSVWTTNPWRRETLRAEIREAMWFALLEAGIVIAYPQLDVHFDPPVQSALDKGADILALAKEPSQQAG